MANKTVTIKPSGGDYTSIQSAWNAEKALLADLVANTRKLTFAVSGDWSGTSLLTFDLTAGFTANASYYPEIVFDTGNRAGLVWSTTKFRMVPSSANAWCGQIKQAFTRITGLQMDCSVGAYGIEVTAPDVIIDSFWIKNAKIYGINCQALRLCLRNGTISGTTSDGIGLNVSPDQSTSCWVQKCQVVKNNGNSIQVGNYRTLYLQDSYCGGNVGASITAGGSSNIFITNSATNDGLYTTATVPYTTATFNNVTAGSENFGTPTGSNLIDAGANLSAVATYPFNWDITGTTITGSWDIGAAEHASAPTLRTLSYNGNGSTGGTVPSNQTGYAGDSITTSANTGTLTLANRELDHWNTAANGSGTSYLIGESVVMPDANLVLYAVWNAFTTIRKGKITWVLDAIYPHGTFVKGDAWVVGPVTAVSVTPAYATINGTHQNGSMTNPVCGFAQSYDSRVQELTYTAPPSYPLALAVNSSLVSTISASPQTINAGTSLMIQSAEVLTVLGTTPSAGTFRPALIGTTKTLYNISQINLNLIPALAVTASTPTEAYVTANVTSMLTKPWLVHGQGSNHRWIMPIDNSPAYHQAVQELLVQACLLAVTNFGDRTALLHGLIQVAIDYYGMQIDGNRTSTEGGYNWRLPVIFAGHVMGISGMKRMWQDTTWSYNSYHGRLIYYKAGSNRTIQSTVLANTTDTWTRYHNATGKTAVFYDVDRLETHNYGTHEELHPSEWMDHAKVLYPEGGYKLEAYRDQNAGMIPTNAFLVRFLGIKETLNYNQMLDYADRWMYESRAMLQAAGDITSTDTVQTTSSIFGNELWARDRNISDTAPAIPAGLGGSVVGSDVHLSWTASARARLYKVLRGTTEIALTSGTTFTDVGVTSGVYTVKAVNMEDVSSASNSVTLGGTTRAITYSANGGIGTQVDVSSPYADGASVTVLGLGTIARAGYTFTGWNTAANGSGTARSIGDSFIITSATVMYAQWLVIPTYAITYNGNTNTGGTVPSAQVKTQGVSLTLALNTGTLVKTGYILSGWNILATGLGTHYALGAAFTTDAVTTLYAEWSASVVVVYGGNGSTTGTVPVDSTAYALGDTLLCLGNPGNLVRTNYIWVGWRKAPATGRIYTLGDSVIVEPAMTLYACWIPKSGVSGDSGSVFSTSVWG